MNKDTLFNCFFISFNTFSNYIILSVTDPLMPSTHKFFHSTTDGFKGQSINSPVISLTLFDELTEGSDMTTQLNQPITLEIKVLDSNMTNPQCLFWNFTL